MSAEQAPMTARESELRRELTTWQEIYQETVLRSGGPKALAKIKAVMDEIKAEAQNERLQA